MILLPVTWHHYILRQESLAAKFLHMSNVTRVVISIVNWIPANALDYRKFKKFFIDVDADYGDLVMFIAVRQLSLAICPKKFYNLIPKSKTLVEGEKDISQLSNEQ